MKKGAFRELIGVMLDQYGLAGLYQMQDNPRCYSKDDLAKSCLWWAFPCWPKDKKEITFQDVIGSYNDQHPDCEAVLDSDSLAIKAKKIATAYVEHETLLCGVR